MATVYPYFAFYSGFVFLQLKTNFYEKTLKFGFFRGKWKRISNAEIRET